MFPSQIFHNKKQRLVRKVLGKKKKQKHAMLYNIQSKIPNCVPNNSAFPSHDRVKMTLKSVMAKLVSSVTLALTAGTMSLPQSAAQRRQPVLLHFHLASLSSSFPFPLCIWLLLVVALDSNLFISFFPRHCPVLVSVVVPFAFLFSFSSSCWMIDHASQFFFILAASLLQINPSVSEQECYTSTETLLGLNRLI